MSEEQRISEGEAEHHLFAIVRRLENFPAVWAARFNGSVWLVGSALVTPDYRDVDLRIVMEDHDFYNRYHMLPKGWETAPRSQRWVTDVGKMNATLAKRSVGNVDVTVWPASHFREDCDGRHQPLLLATAKPTRRRRPLTDEERAALAALTTPFTRDD